MIKGKKQMFIVIGVFTLVLMLGTVTYAFFNYTRTGTANVIKTGKISFDSTQGQAINLTNMFPIDVSEGIPDDATKVGTVTINVTGDTTYNEGLEYLVSAVNVSNTVGNKSLPISIDVAVSNNTNNDPATTLGTSDDDYYTDRGGDTSYYKILAGETINIDDQLVVGYIAPGSAGVDGNIVIRAYLDASKIAISDTYDESDPGTDNMGTTSEWVDDRETFTTTEWNSLQTNGVSFQIKVESNEGIWVEEPPKPAYQVIGALQSVVEVAGAKRYVGSSPNNYVVFNDEVWRIIGVYGNQLKIIKNTPLEDKQQYNDSTSSNSWDNSSVQTYLINTYYPTISNTAKTMIDENATWNVGAAKANASAVMAYTTAQSTTWTGKIGLIGSYEYLYAADSTCHDKPGDYDNFYPTCASSDWLWNVVTSSDYAWTITPDIDHNYEALNMSNLWGYVTNEHVITNRLISPVVYLKPEVTITGGTGKSGGNEYTLGYVAQ